MLTRIRTILSGPSTLALTLPALCLLGACARVAPIAGYEFGVPLTVDRTAGLVNTYRNEGTGKSTNHTLRFGAAIESDRVLPPGLLLSPRVALAISNGRFTADPPFRVDDPAAASPISTRWYDVYSTLTVVQLDAPVLVDLTGAFFAAVGPSVSYRISTGFIQTEHIQTPEDFTYPDGSRSRVTQTGDTLGSAPLRLGAIAGFGVTWREPLGAALQLRPELYGRVDIASLASLGRRALSIGATVSFLPLPQAAPVPIAPVAPAVDTPARAASPQPPRASIALRLADDGPLRSTGTLERLELPLPLTIGFAHGSDRLVTETTPETAARLGIDSLARLSAAELQSRTLDVVAMRLRSLPTATVTLRGGRAGDEDRSLAQWRAEAVRDYLRSVWSIDPARVRISREETTAPEVRIGLDAPLAAPIVTRWVTRSYSAPRIALRHSIDAPAGVRFWEITLRQAERVVARASEGNGDSVLAADVSLGGGLLPIVGELLVIDSAGQRTIARDTLRLREHAVHGPITRERRELIVMPGEVLAERARVIAEDLRDGAEITIERLGLARNAPTDVSSTRMAGLLLAEVGRRGIQIGGLRVDEAAGAPAPGALAGALRVVVVQEYAESGD